MNPRRTFFALIVAVLVLILAPVSLPQPRGAGDSPGRGERGPCVGVTTAVLRAPNPVITRVYRAFADGSVETYDDGSPDAKWTPLGR